jgi:hypothetical protein
MTHAAIEAFLRRWSRNEMTQVKPLVSVRDWTDSGVRYQQERISVLRSHGIGVPKYTQSVRIGLRCCIAPYPRRSSHDAGSRLLRS